MASVITTTPVRGVPFVGGRERWMSRSRGGPALAALVSVMVVIDFFIFGRGRRQVTLKEWAARSVLWFALAIGFRAVLWSWRGSQAARDATCRRELPTRLR